MADHRGPGRIESVTIGLRSVVHRMVPRTRNQRVAAVAAAGALLVLIGLLVVFLPDSSRPIPPSPSRPAPVAQVPRSEVSTAPSSRAATRSKPRPSCTAPARNSALSASTPLRLCIPAIDVQSDLLQLGLNEDRTVQVPTLAQVREAGWYKYSPAPGSVGPSVILGHVDSAEYGKGVFFDLVKLHAGDPVTFYRADGRVATYRVNRVQQYPKSSFPTEAVYGNTAGPEMRLITCGGTFDPQARSYEDNIIVFGSLVSLK